MFNLLAADKGLSEILLEAGERSVLEGESRIRYYTFTNNFLRIHENAYLQHMEGSDEFAEYMESEIIPLPAKPNIRRPGAN